MTTPEIYSRPSSLSIPALVTDNILKTLSSTDAVAVANPYAPGAVMIQAELSSPVHGRDAHLEYYKGMLRAITDGKVDIPFLGRGIG